jgi:predicted MFS family arabinose efflux permease
MTIVGAGAGIAELTALAVTSELAPTRKRGKYVSILIFTIVPFVPSGIYAQLIAFYKGWRYCGIIICVWNGLGFLLTLFFYFPPPRVNSLGKTKQQILKEIDFIGGFLMISGLVLFMAGMQCLSYPS